MKLLAPASAARSGPRQEGAAASGHETPSGRAAALHSRALAGAALADEPEPGRAPTARNAPALPGLGVLAVALVGGALGLAATAAVLHRGWDPGAVAVGPWLARPRVGTAAIDPYARAELARRGAVPMAAGEGLAFTAATDDTGYRLLRSCFYRLSGGTPPARFWTLTASDPTGAVIGNAADRAGFASNAVVRDAAGGVAIEVGPRARPGNWLPLSGDGPMILTLRLYGTPLTGNAGGVAGARLPAIAREGCGAAP